MSIFSRKSIIAIFLIGFAMIFAVSCDRNQEVSDCGTISVAEMDWASAEMFAHIDKVVLENGYGCEIELVPGAKIFSFEGGHNIINSRTKEIISLISDFKSNNLNN